jgi:hypothetical protein
LLSEIRGQVFSKPYRGFRGTSRRSNAISLGFFQDAGV